MKFLFLSIFSILFFVQTTIAQDHLCGHACKHIHEGGALFYKSQASVFRQTQDYDLHYHRMKWKIDPDTLFIEGSVSSRFRVTSASLSELYFDFDSLMTVDSVVYHGQGISFDFAGRNALRIYLPNTLVSQAIDSVTIYYHGTPSSNGFGSFAKGLHEGYPIIWTLSEPYGSQDWWPCKHSLNDKIDSIDIIVTTPVPNRVASNGVLVSEKTDGVLSTFHWRHRYPIAAYLVAIAVTNFTVFTDHVGFGSDSFPIVNYIYPEDSARLRADARRTVPIMEFFMDIFGPYPFHEEKYGHAQFGRGGGMEHQTMSFMVNLNEFLVAHELAHQWFGDKVTCHSWSDIWLNEGFATYSEALVLEEFYSSYAFFEWRRDRINYITSRDGGSVYVYARDTLNVSRVFSYRYSYAKAALVLHMLRYKMGDSMFFKAVKNYINDPDLAFDYARTPDLQYHFEAVYGADLSEFFDDWVYGQGYPSYETEWQQIGSKFQLQVWQESSHNSVDFFEMPLEFVLFGENTFKKLRVEHHYSGQVFIDDVGFKVDSVVFDEFRNIISRDNVLRRNTLEILQEGGLWIYPNPTEFNITKVVLLGNETPVSFSVYDPMGRLVWEQELAADHRSWFDLNTGDLKPSLYYIRVNGSEGAVFTAGFVKL